MKTFLTGALVFDLKRATTADDDLNEVVEEGSGLNTSWENGLGLSLWTCSWSKGSDDFKSTTLVLATLLLDMSNMVWAIVSLGFELWCTEYLLSRSQFKEGTRGVCETCSVRSHWRDMDMVCEQLMGN